jgi:hypothetical protein
VYLLYVLALFHRLANVGLSGKLREIEVKRGLWRVFYTFNIMPLSLALRVQKRKWDVTKASWEKRRALWSAAPGSDFLALVSFSASTRR